MMKMLLVDDVNFSLEMAKAALSETATEIRTANNGLNALDVMRNYRPDIVLLDLFMPVMNGDECCRLIKNDPELKHIPVLIISSIDDPAHRDRCFGAGCDDLLKKPFTREALLEKIQKHRRPTRPDC